MRKGGEFPSEVGSPGEGWGKEEDTDCSPKAARVVCKNFTIVCFHVYNLNRLSEVSTFRAVHVTPAYRSTAAPRITSFRYNMDEVLEECTPTYVY